MHTPILAGQLFSSAVGKCVCVGRNYAEHAKELNNPIPSRPLLFLKPADAVVPMAEPIQLPEGLVHHELEVAILIGQKLSKATVEQASAAIAGIGLALDLTLRELQSQLKEKGQPWEVAKAFDGACPVSEFIPLAELDLKQLSFSLKRNGQLQQQGNSADMLFPVLELISYISQIFTLNPGDLILTGTPAGVGPLTAGDQLELNLANRLSLNARVCSV